MNPARTAPAASERRLAFVIPSLSAAAAQDEDVAQLLLVAAARIEQSLHDGAGHVSATVIVVGSETQGWATLSSMFSREALARVTVRPLPEAPVASLATGAHKAAYDLFEYLKTETFDEVHSVDRGGIAYYATSARRLGLYFLKTAFAVHVVGGRFFRAHAGDELIDHFNALSDDLLERGSVERADAVFVHDRKAWRWYAGKIAVRDGVAVHDLAHTRDDAVPSPVVAAAPPPPPSTAESAPTSTTATAGAAAPAASQRPVFVYYGRLAADGGLPLFCDAVDRIVTCGPARFDVAIIGAAGAMGGMDAVSYVRLRSERWGVPVTIRRDLSLDDEIAELTALDGVVFCDTRRREALRARLLLRSGFSVVHAAGADAADFLNAASTNAADFANAAGADAAGFLNVAGADAADFGQASASLTVRSDNPADVADALTTVARARRPHDVHRRTASELWAHGRAPLRLDGAAPLAPLALPQQPPKVSVCVTHYRRPEKLRIALESLRRQTYPDFEVIVVDDGSDERQVREELDLIAGEVAALGWRIVTQGNRYLGAARNAAARLATGEYLLFMDDDNVAKPEEIATLVAVACRSGAEIVTTFYDGFGGDGAPGDGDAVVRYTPYGPDPALGVFTNCFGDANALFSRAAFDRLGGFTEDYGITHEDWELLARAAIAGVSMVCVPEPLFWYRMDAGGMFHGSRKQLHEIANRRRHVRPHVEALPWWQAKLVALAQGLTTQLPVAPVGPATRAPHATIRPHASQLPYARVAVVMRTKDRPLLLARAIRSVLGQSFRDWLLVIVDDGGEPENVALALGGAAEELAGRVVVVSHAIGLGMPGAANAGIARCDSDYVAIHDDDDTWDPAFLARTVSYLDEQGWRAKLGGVVTRTNVLVEDVGDDGEIRVRDRFLFDPRLESLSLAQLAVENRFPPISLLFRRAAFDSVGPFKDQHGPLGDWDFHLRLLARFDIDVITDALANYHHRPSGTAGAYGNSVHAQLDVHRARRADLVNEALRSGGVLSPHAANGHAAGGPLDGNGNGDDAAAVARSGQATPPGVSLAQLLAMGDLQHRVLDEQRREFQRLHDYVSAVDQKLERKLDGIGARVGSEAAARRRNLLINGDFRRWPGPSPLRHGPGRAYAYVQVCPGFVLSFDGGRVAYRVERRTWSTNGAGLPFGKRYLHVEREDDRGDATWFTLELLVGAIAPVAGRTVCISGAGRLLAATDRLEATGRYHLAGGHLLDWPTAAFGVGPQFQRWSVCLPCPAVDTTAIDRNSYARVLLRLPHDQPFELDVTDVQVEIGTTASDFEYRSDGLGPFAQLRGLRQRVRDTLGRLRDEDDSAS